VAGTPRSSIGYRASKGMGEVGRQKGFASNGILMKYRNLREKILAFDQYGGPVCACCGVSEWCFLSLDHIGGDGSSERREFFKSKFTAGHHMFRELRLRGYPPGYQVLCMNCNAGRFRNGGTCPHKAEKPLSGRELLAAFESLRVGSNGSTQTRKAPPRLASAKARRKSPTSPSDILAGISQPEHSNGLVN
jgi:hypothetical protein